MTYDIIERVVNGWDDEDGINIIGHTNVESEAKKMVDIMNKQAPKAIGGVPEYEYCYKKSEYLFIVTCPKCRTENVLVSRYEMSFRCIGCDKVWDLTGNISRRHDEANRDIR